MLQIIEKSVAWEEMPRRRFGVFGDLGCFGQSWPTPEVALFWIVHLE